MKRQTLIFTLALASLVASAAVIAIKLEPEAIAGGMEARAVEERQFVEYRVRAGDNLFRISQSFLGDAHRWREIASFNGITNPAAMRAGDALRIPMNGVTPAPEAQPYNETSMAIVTDDEVLVTHGDAAGFMFRAPEGGEFRHMIPYQGSLYAVFSLHGDDHYTQRIALDDEGKPGVTDILPSCALAIAYDCGSVQPDASLMDLVERN